eukprot:COSAG05_NODE_553_length_8711_cov_165.199257_5_plen_492_part_00
MSLRCLVPLLLSSTAASQGVVGPGGVTQYSGGAARQQRGYGTVREPAEGFYIGGSTIKEMNGVYKRVQHSSATQHSAQLVYRQWSADKPDPGTGWEMMLAESPEDGGVGGKSTEWLIVDASHKDRFGHVGDTIIPGAGTSWEFVHRDEDSEAQQGDAGDGDPASDDWNEKAEPEGPNKDAVDTIGGGEKDSKPKGDDEDELPWQVIFIGDFSMMENLRRHQWHYDSEIKRAIGGSDLPPSAGGMGDSTFTARQTPPERGPLSADAEGETALKGAAALFEEGQFAEAAARYDLELHRDCQACTEHSGGAKWNAWREGTLLLAKAAANRRARVFAAALDDLSTVLETYPTWKLALLERGIALFDMGRAPAALKVFEQLLRLETDRDNLSVPEVRDWLIRTKAVIRRASDAADAAAEEERLMSLAPTPSEAEQMRLDQALERSCVLPPCAAMHHTTPPRAISPSVLALSISARFDWHLPLQPELVSRSPSRCPA